MHTTWSSHPGAWCTHDTCQSGSCSERAPRSTHGRWTEHTSFSLLSSCSFLPLSPSFLLFLSSRNQQNKSSNIFTQPRELFWTSRKSAQWTRLLPPGPSLCLCDPGPVTFHHGAYWALLLSLLHFTLHPSSQLITGGQKQASLQNTSNSKGQT